MGLGGGTVRKPGVRQGRAGGLQWRCRAQLHIAGEEAWRSCGKAGEEQGITGGKLQRRS